MSTQNTTVLVESIRTASRQLVRELGFTGKKFAGTDLSPSAVHALIEIESDCLTAREISSRLHLDKSSVSRMLGKLVERGLVAEFRGRDRRSKSLSLTASGEELVSRIHAVARGQVSRALQVLTPEQHERVLEGIALYAAALRGEGREHGPGLRTEVVDAYVPGIIARITQMHIDFYARTAGFGQAFEAGVAAGLSEFSQRMHRPANSLWVAKHGASVLGSIAIDGEGLGGRIAQLRWFIVEDAVQGSGAGGALLSSALRFVDQLQFAETHLWTFDGLEAARHLYEANGFDLVEQRPGTQWGAEVLEQRFVRKTPAAAW